MTTINGVTFNMNSLEIVGTHRNVPNEQPGSDESFITDMGYRGLVLRMTGFEKTLAKYDEVINEFMKTGVHALIHRTDWQFSVYSTRLVPILDAGIVDNFFPYELVLLTSTPYRESSSLSCRAKAITANNQEWSAEDMPCDNLLDNWSFEDWTAGTSSAPDEWVLFGAGASIARNSSPKVGTYCAALTRAGANTELYQLIPSSYAGKEITFGCWVKSSISGAAVGISIYSNLGTSSQTAHTNGGAWEWLTVTFTVPSGATTIRADAELFTVDGTAYFDGAVLVEGDSIPDSTFTRNISTTGSVDAVPDIQVTGRTGAYTALSPEPVGEPGFETIAGWTYSEVDTPGSLSGSQSGATKTEGSFSYNINRGAGANNPVGDYGQVARNVNFDDIEQLTFDYRLTRQVPVNSDAISARVLIDSDVVADYPSALDTDTGWVAKSIDVIEYVGTHSLKFQLYYNIADNVLSNVFVDNIISKDRPNVDTPQIYNTDDTTVKCDVGNVILDGAIHRINTDGTGTVDYDDDFSDSKFGHDATAYLNVSRDTVNDELDIADDGYIYWNKDVKYPTTGIPTLTSRVNITAGIPTIQISSDGITWYDITTAIVDDVDTVYDLDCSSLHLKGLTEFYWRYDCVKAAAATCSIKSFELGVDFITIDVEHPKISSNGASTIRCNQDTDSGMNCIVALIYRDRSWPV